MSRSQTILLDTNRVIALLETVEGREELRQLLINPQIELVVTPLIRFEVLSKPNTSNAHFDKLDQAMDGFKTYEIGSDEARLAAKLITRVMEEKARRVAEKKESYSDEQKKITKLKLRFDVFHVASAKVNSLNLKSQDKDIELIQDVLATNLETP
jgi:hypothetical protein